MVVALIKPFNFSKSKYKMYTENRTHNKAPFIYLFITE